MKISPSLEKRWKELFEQTFGPDVYPQKQLREIIRPQIRSIAYHEAGHAVARMFTGHESGHVRYVSIFPAKGSAGREVYERAATGLANYPDWMKQNNGRCLLLNILGGRGAEHRLAPDWEKEEVIDPDSEEWEIVGSDLFHAAYISKIMARKGMSQNRILQLAEKWTIEMMALPKVWECTEQLAAALLEKGTVRRSGIFKICEGILDMALSQPLWKRRLFQAPLPEDIEGAE